MTLTGYWQIGKWGLAAILSLSGIAVILFWQANSYHYEEVAGERPAGLAAVSRSERMPAMFAITEPSASEPDPSGPMIIQTLSLKFIAPALNDAQNKIDDIIRRFHGYIDMLTMRSDIGLAHSLSATVRIPADQLSYAVTELKTVGSLTEESQTTQDTTAGYTDLVARLSNARKTEQRLLTLLTERAGKLGEIVEVEKQIGEVRERIERMEGQQPRIENQVKFASIKLEFTEQSQALTAGTQLRTAFNEGYRAAAANIVLLALATLRYGPTVVIDFLLLFPLIIVFYRRVRVKLESS
jgi:uncharacterized protein DUF4349